MYSKEIYPDLQNYTETISTSNKSSKTKSRQQWNFNITSLNRPHDVKEIYYSKVIPKKYRRRNIKFNPLPFEVFLI